MPSLDLHMNQTGGFFTRINQDLSEARTKILDALAQRGEDLVSERLPEVLQNPTGYYQSQITHQSTGPDTAVVTDQGVSYGAWLEGVGSRNAPVTSFEGYHTFREVCDQLSAEAADIAEKHLSGIGE